MEISETILGYAKSLSEKVDLPVEEVLEEFRKAYEERFKETPLPEEKKQERAWRAVVAKFSRELGPIAKKAIWFKGWILGYTPLMDRIEALKRRALKAYESDPQNAILMGLTTQDGTPLDTRTTVFGRPNPNLGQPLAGHAYSRTIFLVASRSQEENYKLARLSVFDEMAKEIMTTVKRLAPVKFRAILKGDEEAYRLNASVLTTFLSETSLPDLEEVLERLPKVPVASLEEWHEINKGDRGRCVVTEGIVGYLNLEPNPRTLSRTMRLCGPEGTTITCFIPQDIEINFGEESRVLVLGKTNRGKQGLFIDVYGLYAYESDLVLG